MTKPFLNSIHLRSFLKAVLTGRLSDQGIWQKIVVLGIKIIVLVFSGWYLYVHVLENTKFKDVYTQSAYILSNPSSVWILSLCLTMVLLNWSIETIKWQFLLKRFAHITFLRAFSAILSGNTISLWSPNRVGEYLGRVVFLDAAVRIKSIFATLAGSIAQLVITLVMGTLGFVYYEKMSHAPELIQLGIGFVGLIFIGLLLFFYFNIGIIRSWLPAKNWAKGLRKSLLIYKQYKRKELETVLLYSLIRYLVFSMQFYVLLIFFGVHIPLIQALILIFIMYMIQTVSPTTGVTELLVRGTTAVFLFQSFTNNMTGVLSASYGIWIINLLVPALIGAVIFGFARINKRLRNA